jgi:Ala-tRNA(Pro) deacylase
MMNRDGLLELLERNGVRFQCERHEQVLNMQESETLELSLPGVRCKNLLLHDRQGRYYLIVTTANKSLDLSSVAKTLDSKRLSFASAERLFDLLGVRPGSLSPLAFRLDRRTDLAVSSARKHSDSCPVETGSRRIPAEH